MGHQVYNLTAFGYPTVVFCSLNGIWFVLLQTSAEMKKLHDDLSQKISAVELLQRELSKRKDEGEKVIDNLKQSIGALEKENSSLKVSIITYTDLMKSFAALILLLGLLIIIIILIPISRRKKTNLRLQWK